MPRKLRLEFPGAICHVINRGNYRADIFRTEGAKAAFEECLFAACAKSGWVLHAYVLMSNHYHLALETPEGNLAAGMQWLQSTFANRFNRLRGERGPLFQGRYKSLLVEEGEPLGQVCHYIQLNPVRAGLCTVEQLGDYRYGSYWYLRRPKRRPAFMAVTTPLGEAGGLADTKAGWQAYARYLSWQASEGPAGKNQAYVTMSKGWALGSGEFKAALVKDHAVAAATRSWEAQGAREIRALQWGAALRRALAAVRRSTQNPAEERKSAPWKLAVAVWMKTHTQAGNPWLCHQLHLGAPAALSRNLAHYRQHQQAGDPAWKQLISISSA